MQLLNAVLRVSLAGLGTIGTALTTYFFLQIMRQKDGWGALGFVYVIAPVAGCVSLAWAIHSLVWLLRTRNKQAGIMLGLSAISIAVILVETLVLISTPMSG